MPLEISEIPYRLKRLRETTGMSQVDAARVMGVVQAQVSGWECGKNLPNIEGFAKLAHAYGTTVAAILDEKEPHLAPPRPPNRVEMAMWILEAIDIPAPKVEFVRSIINGPSNL